MKFSNYASRELKTAWIMAFAFVIAGFLVAFLWEVAAGFTLCGLTVLIWLSFSMFFRDPERNIPQDPDILVSPADGVVRDIELVTNAPENEYYEGGNAVRIGIFLSVLDVHINRAPCDLEVKEITKRKGKYHDARSPQASEENEAVTMVGQAKLEDTGSFTVIVRQISGAIAKRIVCDVQEGATLFKGQRYGMIKFGSRTELFFPAKSCFELTVKVGDRVHAGSTPVLRFNKKAV